jgi:hypothetical protein
MHDVLLGYIALHDEFFRFRWSRIIPIPGLFSPIDFEALFRRLYYSHDQLESITCQLPRESPFEPDLLDALTSYSDALHRAIIALKRVCGKLMSKAQGAGYPREEYDRDIGSYMALVGEYRTKGEVLNRVLGENR